MSRVNSLKSKLGKASSLILEKFLPLFEYHCPKCLKMIPPKPREKDWICPRCGFYITLPPEMLRFPPQVLKSKQATDYYLNTAILKSKKYSLEDKRLLVKLIDLIYFQDQFELGLGAWTSNGTWGGGAVAIGPGGHHGANQLNITNLLNLGDGGWVEHDFGDFSGINSIYGRGYIKYIQQVPVGWTDGCLLYWENFGAGLLSPYMTWDQPNNKWGLQAVVGGVFVNYWEVGVSVVNPDVWYCQSGYIFYDNVNGAFDFWVDGVNKVNVVGVDSRDGGAQVMRGQAMCQIENNQAGARSVAVDCCVFASTAAEIACEVSVSSSAASKLIAMAELLLEE